MQADKLQTRPVQILTAIFRPESGPAGIGIAVADAPANTIGGLREQAIGSREYLLFRAILRALQLGKELHAERIAILCPDEDSVRLINREMPLKPGSGLVPCYMRIRALMHTYRAAEVRVAPRSRVEPARRLAIAASRMPVRKPDPQRSLFAAAG